MRADQQWSARRFRRKLKLRKEADNLAVRARAAVSKARRRLISEMQALKCSILARFLWPRVWRRAVARCSLLGPVRALWGLRWSLYSPGPGPRLRAQGPGPGPGGSDPGPLSGTPSALEKIPSAVGGDLGSRGVFGRSPTPQAAIPRHLQTAIPRVGGPAQGAGAGALGPGAAHPLGALK